MKNLVIIAAMVMITVSAQSQGNNVKVTPSVNRSFSREFTLASNARWEKISNNLFFVMFDEKTPNSIAYFKDDGELLIKGQIISFDDLPQMVQAGLQTAIKPFEREKGALNVTHTYRISENGVTRYYVNCANNAFFLSVMSSKKGKTKVIREIDVAPGQKVTPLISIL